MSESNKPLSKSLIVTALLFFIAASSAIILYVPSKAHYTVTHNFIQESPSIPIGRITIPYSLQHQDIDDILVYFDKDFPLPVTISKSHESYIIDLEAKDSLAYNPRGLLPLKVQYKLNYHENKALETTEPDFRYYLGPEKGMETAYPQLISRARSIAPGDMTQEEQVEALKTYLISTIALSQNSSQSAQKTLDEQSGNQIDRALLFGALCRTRGIASRLKQGLTLKLFLPNQSKKISNQDLSLNYWPEYFHKEHGWQKVNLPKVASFKKPSWPVLDLGEYNLTDINYNLEFTSLEIKLVSYNKTTYILLAFTLFILSTIIIFRYKGKEETM